MSEIPLGADLPIGTWRCEYCGEENSDLDGECQFCDGADLQPENDPAWQSEARLRDMEGVGDYEGPRNWP